MEDFFTSPKHFPAKKSLGQHFLTSDLVPRWMADAAEVTSESTVLEIGAGTGVLTTELLRRGATVHAIETDTRSAALLHTQFAKEIQSGALHIYEHDLREGMPSELCLEQTPYSVVANVPYYLSGFLLRNFLEHSPPPHTLVFLLQKELVTRIARDQKGSLISMAVRAFGTPHVVRNVTPGHFSPPPKVHSAILGIYHITHDRVPPSNRAHVFRVLRTGFAHKRKQLQSNLERRWPRSIVRQSFTTLKLPATVRAEELSLSTWLQLAALLPPGPPSYTRDTATENT
jgi:16S rRNA (adenine1518-N6/adenine1519-N6)-dimethyltransferase